VETVIPRWQDCFLHTALASMSSFPFPAMIIETGGPHSNSYILNNSNMASRTSLLFNGRLLDGTVRLAIPWATSCLCTAQALSVAA